MDENKRSDFLHWAKVSSQAKYNLAISGITHYPLKELGVTIDDLEISGPTFYGYEPLQNELAAKCGVNPDCVAAVTGTAMANHLVLAGTLTAGDEVLIEHPTYEPILAVAQYLGASIQRFPRRFEEGFRVIPENLRQLVTSKTKLIVLTNLHNPSGVWTTQETLKEIGAIAKEAGAKVLVDEVYLECLFPTSGSAVSSFHLGNEFIATGSLTKGYGLSGLRCGWILAEPDWIRKFWRLIDLFYATPPHTSELLSVIALRQLPKIAERAKRLLQPNRIHLGTILDSVNYFLDVVIPENGTIVFPRLKSGNGPAFIDILRNEYETSVAPGSFFEMPDHFRIGVGGLSENVHQGLENFRDAVMATSYKANE